MPYKFIEELKQGHRHTFEREDEILGKRECTIEVDDPGYDSTDFAHPAWFRAADHTVSVVVQQLNKILNGEAHRGVSSSKDLQDLRISLLSLVDMSTDFKEFLRDIEVNWDCDKDSHRYNTPCRCCEAEKLRTKYDWREEEWPHDDKE